MEPSIMKPREALLDSLYGYFALTINVYPEKRVQHDGRTHIWRRLKYDDQKAIILHTLQCALGFASIPLDKLEYYWEDTEAGFPHMHASVRTNDVNKIAEAQQYVHKHLGLPYASPQRVCYVEQTYFKSNYWDSYMKKQQTENNDVDSPNFIPNQSMFVH